MRSPPQEDVHFRVLRLLAKRPAISQRELAEDVGIALGEVNYALKALTERGLGMIRNFRNSDNKLRYFDPCRTADQGRSHRRLPAAQTC